jgi:hypothetical protein
VGHQPRNEKREERRAKMQDYPLSTILEAILFFGFHSAVEESQESTVAQPSQAEVSGIVPHFAETPTNSVPYHINIFQLISEQ